MTRLQPGCIAKKGDMPQAKRRGNYAAAFFKSTGSNQPAKDPEIPAKSPENPADPVLG
jgi:hypothetical protein